jgi:HEXXH motif-containing protein
MSPTVLSLATAECFSAPPLPAGDSALPGFVVGEYARALVELAFAQCERLLRLSNPGIIEQAAAITRGALPWGAVWSPDLAQLEAVLRGSANPTDIWSVLARLLLQLGAEGYVAEADIRLQSPQALRWGRIRIPLADRIAFRRTGAGAEVVLDIAGTRIAEISMEQSADGVWTGGECDNLPVLRFGGFPMMVDAQGSAASERMPGGSAPLAAVPEGTDAVFAEAAALIAAYSPAYLPWVAQAVRTIVPLDVRTGRVSATVEQFPGLVFLSLPLSAAEIAARFVHEASHQYYFALRRLATLEDGSDRKMYYSPIKRTDRAIDMILFAFHAFGNGALFHRDLFRGDSLYHELNGQTLESNLEPVRIMHGYLVETRALTPMGRTLCGPVADRLFGRSG